MYGTTKKNSLLFLNSGAKKTPNEAHIVYKQPWPHATVKVENVRDYAQDIW